jgi:hypothetical protein
VRTRFRLEPQRAYAHSRNLQEPRLIGFCRRSPRLRRPSAAPCRTERNLEFTLSPANCGRLPAETSAETTSPSAVNSCRQAESFAFRTPAPDATSARPSA